MKKLSRLLFLIILVLGLMMPVQAEPSLNLPFSEGEELIYDVYYKKMKLGTSKLTFNGVKSIDGEDFYHVTFYTEVPGFKDTEEIYAYKDTFLPFIISRNIKRLGAFPMNIEERYDQEAFTVDIKNKGIFRSKKQTIRKDGPIYNALLLTYYYRAKPDIEGLPRQKISLPMADFEIILKGEEIVSTKAGDRLAYVFAGEPSKFTFWLSRDEKRIPVKIKGHSVLDYSLVLNSVSSKVLSEIPVKKKNRKWGFWK